MKRFFHKLLRCSILFSLTVLAACGSDEEPIDKTPTDGSIEILSPAANDLLIGTITVDAEITLENFDGATVFLDETIIGESFDEVINFSYDTKAVEDGMYTLRVVAVDTAGTEVEASLEVEILNTLLTYSVPAGKLENDEELWVFITGDDGQLWYVERAANGQTLTFETPETYERDQHFTVHQLFHKDYPIFDLTSTDIQSYTQATPGQYYFKSDGWKDPIAGSIGTYELTVTNVGSEYLPSSFGEAWAGDAVFKTGNTYRFETELYQNNTDMLYHFGDYNNRALVPRYKLYKNISQGGTASSAFSEFTAMNQTTLTFTEQKDVIYGAIYPIIDGIQYKFPIDDHDPENVNTVKLYYPGNSYDSYLTSLWAQKGNKTNTYLAIGSVPSSAVNTLTANISSLTHDDGIITAHTTGTYDVLHLFSSEYWEGSGMEHELTWSYATVDADQQQIEVADLPGEILSAYPELNNAVVRFDYAEAMKFDTFENYTDYLDNSVKTADLSTTAFGERMGVGVNFNDDEPGRKASRKHKPVKRTIFNY